MALGPESSRIPETERVADRNSGLKSPLISATSLNHYSPRWPGQDFISSYHEHNLGMRDLKTVNLLWKEQPRTQTVPVLVPSLVIGQIRSAQSDCRCVSMSAHPVRGTATWHQWSASALQLDITGESSP